MSMLHLPRSNPTGGETIPSPRAEPTPGELRIDLREGSPDPRPILIVHSSDDMYGADRMLLEVIGSMTDQDRDRVMVWLPSDYGHGATPLCEKLREEGIACEHVSLPIVRRRYLNARGLAALGRRAWEARRRLAMLDPSEIVLATSAVLPISPIIGSQSSARVFLHMQEVWDEREARVLGLLASRVDRVIAISEAAAASLPEHLRERTVVVPNSTPAPSVTSSLTERPAQLTFLAAGRWTAGKGYGVLIEAWDAAECPGTLVILGGPPLMGVGVDVPRMVRASRRPDTITVVGEVPDVGSYIDEADVMVVPSTTPEGFGLVTIEAFAHSRPVVASACGGSLETVRGGAGWLVTPGDVGDLAETLGSLTRDSVIDASARASDRYMALYSTTAFRRAMRAARAGVGAPVEGEAAASRQSSLASR